METFGEIHAIKEFTKVFGSRVGLRKTCKLSIGVHWLDIMYISFYWYDGSMDTGAAKDGELAQGRF